MMMIASCIAISLGLIALTFGVGMLIWGYRNQGKCIAVARVFGYIITIASILVLICMTLNCMRGGKKGLRRGPRSQPMMRLQPSQRPQ